MRYLRTLILLAVFLALPVASFALEPSGFFQWNQADRLRLELSESFYPINDKPVQVGKSSDPARSQFNTTIQYRLFEMPSLGKFEVLVVSSLDTHEDIYDRLEMLFGGAYTFGNFRAEIGHERMLNIGTSNRDRGVSLLWVGGSYKVYDEKNVLVDVYGRYYLHSNIHPTVSNQVQDRNRLTAEVGTHLTYQPFKTIEITLAPYGLAGEDYTVQRAGAYATLLYKISEHVTVLPKGVGIELGADYSRDLTPRGKDENRVWVRFLIQF